MEHSTRRHVKQEQEQEGTIEVRVGGRSVNITGIAPDTTLGTLRDLIYEQVGIGPARQRLVLHHGNKEHSMVLRDDHCSLEGYGMTRIRGQVLHLKDLGPQVSYRTVFLLEYAGPLLLHQLLALLYGIDRMSSRQLAPFTLVNLHYVKRLYESLFVHRFSHAVMPLRGCVRNCAYYWLVGGWWLARTIYNDAFTTATTMHNGTLSTQDWVLIGVWTVAQVGNLAAHYRLRWLRPPGSRIRAIPHGFPFYLVSCPNYTFEVISWIAFATLVRLPSAYLFATMGAIQMWLWARKKHAAYLEDFADYPKNRTPMIPFLC